MNLSFEQVEQANRAAAALLRFCALLAPDAIPEELLNDGASELGSVLGPVAADPIKLNEAIEVVRRYSLFKRVTRTNTLSIHRLVQEVLRAQMGPKVRRQWAARVVRALNQVFPEVDFETWARCERLLPQVQACAQWVDQYILTCAKAASLLHGAGNYLRDQGRYSEAEQYYQQALHIYQQVAPADHPDIAPTLHELGRVNLEQGLYSEAEQYFQQALRIKQQALPTNHPSTIITLERYAYLLRQLGRENEALQLEARIKKDERLH